MIPPGRIYRSLSEQEYREALDRLVRVTPVSACTSLLEQATSNPQTRELIIHSMLPTIFQYAMLICIRDPMDLVSVGNLTLMEEWDQAMHEEVPLRYLFNRCKMAMLAYLRQYGYGPLTYPDSGDIEVHPYEFLHLFHFLETDDIEEPHGETGVPFDPTPLYEALEVLPGPHAVELIARLFGLFDRPMETIADIAREGYGSRRYAAKKDRKHYYLKLMKQYLIRQYPDFVEAHACANPSEKAQAKAYIRLYEIGKIPPATRKRLDQARATILARGEELTLKWLRIEAKCGSAAAQAYLYELRVSHG
jgi:hypothetical protein